MHINVSTWAWQHAVQVARVDIMSLNSTWDNVLMELVRTMQQDLPAV